MSEIVEAFANSMEKSMESFVQELKALGVDILTLTSSNADVRSVVQGKIVEERVYGKAPAQASEPDPEEKLPPTMNVAMADLADGVEACAKLANEIAAKLFDAAPDEFETLQKVLCLSDNLALQVERVWRLQDYLALISKRLGN